MSENLPILFSELQRPKTWTNVECVCGGTPVNGRYKVEGNGPFLFMNPVSSSSPKFCIFIANYTPVPDPRRPTVILQHLQFQKFKHILTFGNQQTQNDFMNYCFESLADIETFSGKVDLHDYCNTEPLTGIPVGETKPTNILCVLQESGQGSVVQVHVMSDENVTLGLDMPVTATTHVSPLVDVPRHLKKEKDIMRKSFLVCAADNKEKTETVVICPNEASMMSWVMSIHMAIVLSQKVRTAPPPKPEPKPAPKPEPKPAPKPEPEPELEILVEDIEVEEIEVPDEEPADDFIEKKMKLEAQPISPFSQELKSGNESRLITLCCFLMANGFAKHDSFANAVQKFGIGANLSGNFESNVSTFVTTCLNKNRFGSVLSSINSDEAWLRENYSIGSLMRFPGIISETTDAIKRITKCQVTSDLLRDVSFDDTVLYLKDVAFGFLDIVKLRKKHVNQVPTILRQLENGMLLPGLSMTRGPWKLISECVSHGHVSQDLKDTVNWIKGTDLADEKRQMCSDIDELIFQGLEKRRLCDWILEISKCTQEVSMFYHSSATLADPARAQFVVTHIQKLM